MTFLLIGLFQQTVFKPLLMNIKRICYHETFLDGLKLMEVSIVKEEGYFFQGIICLLVGLCVQIR